MVNNNTHAGDRIQQEETIHQLVEKSVAANFSAAEPSTGKNTHHNEHRKIETWQTAEPIAEIEPTEANESSFDVDTEGNNS